MFFKIDILKIWENSQENVFSRVCLLQSFRLLANLLNLDFFKRLPLRNFWNSQIATFHHNFNRTCKDKNNSTNKIIKNTRWEKISYKKATKQKIPSRISRSFVCRDSACIHLFKFGSRSTRTRCSICSKLAIKIPKRSQRFLLSLMLILNRFHALF